MKTKHILLGAVAAASLAAAVNVQAQLLSYDAFSYPAGALAGQNGGTGFGGAYTANNGGLNTSTPGLNYTDSTGQKLQTAGGEANLAGNNSGVFRALGTTSNADSTIYVSFLEQVTAGNSYAGLSLFTGTGAEHLFLGGGGGGATQGPVINLEAGGPAVGTGETPITSLSFIVVQINFSSITGVSVSLFDNPTLGTMPANANLTQTNGTDFTFDTIRLQTGGDTGTIDEVRIGDTYADVTPVAVPEPSTWVAAAFFSGLAGLANRRRVTGWFRRVSA